MGLLTRTVLLTMVCWSGLPVVLTAQPTTPQRRPLVEIRTELGNMVVALYNETPVHRDNFLELVRTGAYDSLLFHRIVPGFAVEGGDPASKHAEPGVRLGGVPDTVGIPLEVVPGLIHKKGALSAAPAGDTREFVGRSHRNRFFIVQGTTYTAAELAEVVERNARLGTPFSYSNDDREEYSTVGGQPRLDGGYTVFGEVLDGVEVIDALARQPCNAWDRPLKDIRMFMRILE